MEWLESIPAMGSWPLILITGAVFYTCGRVRPLRSLADRRRRLRRIRNVYWAGQLGYEQRACRSSHRPASPRR